MTKESPTVYVLQAIATTKRRKTYSDMGEYESLEEVKEAMKEESREWRERRKKSKLTFSIQIKAKEQMKSWMSQKLNTIGFLQQRAH